VAWAVKLLLGEVTRSGGVNGTPLWYGPRKAATGYSGGTFMHVSASGTTLDTPSTVPAWAKRIEVGVGGLSRSGSSVMLVQIGDSSGIETTSYEAATANHAASTSGNTSGIPMSGGEAAGATWSGTITLLLVDPATNTWAISAMLARTDSAGMNYGAGQKSLSGVLTIVRLTMANGTDTWDAGKVSFQYYS